MIFFAHMKTHRRFINNYDNKIYTQYRFKTWEGKNSFLLRGKLMLGVHWGHLIASFLTIFISWLVFWLLLLPFLHYDEMYLIGLLCFTTNIVLLCATAFFDPGILRRRKSDEYSIIRREASVFRSNYCRICSIVRPSRARHCKYCDNCVDIFDHHCPWTGTCIGIRNYPQFFCFILSVFAGAGLILLTALVILFRWIVMHATTDLYYLRLLALCIAIPWSLASLGVIGTLLSFHVYLIMQQKTTNEYFRDVRARSSIATTTTTTVDQSNCNTANLDVSSSTTINAIIHSQGGGHSTQMDNYNIKLDSSIRNNNHVDYPPPYLSKDGGYSRKMLFREYSGRRDLLHNYAELPPMPRNEDNFRHDLFVQQETGTVMHPSIIALWNSGSSNTSSDVDVRKDNSYYISTPSSLSSSPAITTTTAAAVSLDRATTIETVQMDMAAAVAACVNRETTKITSLGDNDTRHHTTNDGDDDVSMIAIGKCNHHHYDIRYEEKEEEEEEEEEEKKESNDYAVDYDDDDDDDINKPCFIVGAIDSDNNSLSFKEKQDNTLTTIAATAADFTTHYNNDIREKLSMDIEKSIPSQQITAIPETTTTPPSPVTILNNRHNIRVHYYQQLLASSDCKQQQQHIEYPSYSEPYVIKQASENNIIAVNDVYIANNNNSSSNKCHQFCCYYLYLPCYLTATTMSSVSKCNNRSAVVLLHVQSATAPLTSLTAFNQRCCCCTKQIKANDSTFSRENLQRYPYLCSSCHKIKACLQYRRHHNSNTRLEWNPITASSSLNRQQHYSYDYFCGILPIIPATKLLPLWQVEDDDDIEIQELLTEQVVIRIKEEIVDRSAAASTATTE